MEAGKSIDICADTAGNEVKGIENQVESEVFAIFLLRAIYVDQACLAISYKQLVILTHNCRHTSRFLSNRGVKTGICSAVQSCSLTESD